MTNFSRSIKLKKNLVWALMSVKMSWFSAFSKWQSWPPPWIVGDTMTILNIQLYSGKFKYFYTFKSHYKQAFNINVMFCCSAGLVIGNLVGFCLFGKFVLKMDVLKIALIVVRDDLCHWAARSAWTELWEIRWSSW